MLAAWNANAVTMSPPFMLDLVPKPTGRSPLLAHARNVTSQNGEDGIIEHVFALLPPSSRYCVEFGAWDGKTFSNTWNLIHRHGWAGLLIEGDAERFAVLAAENATRGDVHCLNRWVDFEGPNSLDALLAEVNAPSAIDLVSIDIDGIDYFVWDSLTRYRPTLVVVEFNPTVPNDVRFVQARDRLVNQGCSLRALVDLGDRKGYSLVCCTGWNAFFVVAEKANALGVADNRIDTLFTPLADGRIFHGYDGTVHVVGMDRLLWHRVRVGSEHFQVLPEPFRRYPPRKP